MPLYEYDCRACGGRFEVLQKVGEGASEVRCPECGAAGAERRHSTFAAAVGGSAKSAPDSSGCGRPACAGGVCQGFD